MSINTTQSSVDGKKINSRGGLVYCWFMFFLFFSIFFFWVLFHFISFLFGLDFVLFCFETKNVEDQKRYLRVKLYQRKS